MTRPIPAGFSWSASRANVFRDCPRQYFFQYYLATRRAEDAGPDEAAEAARLKQLTSIPLWVGSHVHDAIQRLLTASADGAPLDVEQALDAMVEDMRWDYWESVNRRRASHRDPRQHVRFHEHEYGRTVPRDDWALRVDDARRMVRACAAHGYLDRVRTLGRPAIRALEDLQDWPLDGVKIFVKIDLAFEDEQGWIRILDWKTGQRERGDNPLQMMNYALFALRRWNAAPDRLEVMEVYLRQDRPERPCRIDADSLAAAETAIKVSVDDMVVRLPDPERDIARRGLFEPAPGPRKCRWCNFRSLCPEGQAAL